MSLPEKIEDVKETLKSLKTQVAEIKPNVLVTYVLYPLVIILVLYILWRGFKKLVRRLYLWYRNVTGTDVECQLFPEVHIQMKLD